MCSLRSPFILNEVPIIIFFKEIIIEKGKLKQQPITESALLVNNIVVRFPYSFRGILKRFLFESSISQHSISIFHLFIVGLKNQLFDSENYSIKPFHFTHNKQKGWKYSTVFLPQNFLSHYILSPFHLPFANQVIFLKEKSE